MELEWVKKKVAAFGWRAAGSDRGGAPRAERAAAVRVTRIKPLHAVLSAGAGDGGESAADAADRCGVHTAPLLRQPQADGVAGGAGGDGQSQAGATADAAHG